MSNSVFISSFQGQYVITDPLTGKAEIASDDSMLCLVPKKIKGLNFSFCFSDALADLAHDKLPGACYAILLYLIANADYENWFFLSQKSIADELDMDEKNVCRSFKRLAELGWCLKQQHPRLQKAVWRLAPQLTWKGKLKNFSKACSTTFEQAPIL